MTDRNMLYNKIIRIPHVRFHVFHEGLDRG
jgi:hypothetical protein